MKKLVLLLSTFIFSISTFAAGGFTWISTLIHTPAMQKFLHMIGLDHDPKKSEHVVTLVLIGIILCIVGLIYRSKISKVKDVVVPDKKTSFRNFIELYGNFIYGQCKSIIGEKEGPTYFPFIATVFLVILICNLIGLIPGFLPPTEHLSTTFAFGMFVFVYYNLKGCKEQGTWNYIKHFAGPLWYLAFLIFPIEIISNAIRPLSLALRLKSNMMGDHMVLATFSDLAPMLIPIIFMILGILVSFIQAYVFTILTMVYIQMAVVHHDHDEEHAH